jgi:hypothetical protein
MLVSFRKSAPELSQHHSHAGKLPQISARAFSNTIVKRAAPFFSQQKVPG